MNLLFKNSFALILLVSLSVIITNCSSDDDPESNCDDVISALQATISSDVASVCSEEKAMLTITGTPNAEVNYREGDNSQVVNLDGSGSVSFEVSPSATTVYSLEKITQGDCEKILSGEVTINVGGPIISENIIGTWSVVDANDQSDGKTVTFNSDGTGSAPMDGSFTIYSSNFDEYSDGFFWEYQESLDHLVLRHIFPQINFQINYAIDLNDCDEVILRDVTRVVDPQYTYILTRQ